MGNSNLGRTDAPDRVRFFDRTVPTSIQPERLAGGPHA